MTRPLRNRLIVIAFVVVAFVSSPQLPSELTWILAALALPVVIVALWVTAPFHRARGLLAKKQFDDAATELAAFEKSLVESSWKRAIASLAVGLYTSNAIAAARNTLGGVRLEQGRLDDAATHFDAALAHDALYAVPWANRAVLAATRGDASAARDAQAKAKSLGFGGKQLEAVIAEKLAR